MSIRIWTWLTATIVVIAAAAAICVSWRAEMQSRATLAAELAATKATLAQNEALQKARDAKLADTLAAIEAEKRKIQSPAQIIQDLPNQLNLPVPIVLENINPEDPAAAAQASQAKNAAQQIAARSKDANPASQHLAATQEKTQDAAKQAGAVETEDAAKQQDAAETEDAAKQAGTVETQDAAKQRDASKVQGVIAGADLKPLYDFALECKECQAKLTASQADLADEQTKTKALTKERDDALRIAQGGSIWRRITRATKWLLIGAAAGAAAGAVAATHAAH